MKKLILLFSVWLVNSAALFSQEWAPTGATWYYSFDNFMMDPGYVKIVADGDTIIDGMNCRILKKNLFTNNSKDSFNWEYMYSDSDKVYIYKNQQFYTLYDFSAQAGDCWEIPAGNPYAPCDSSSTLCVDSVSVVVINGFSLRILYTSQPGFSSWCMYGSIIERIGPSNAYMLPEPCCVSDINEGGPFRCYSDEEFGFFETGIVPECDYISSISDYNYFTKIEIFPNPTSGFITINVNNGQQINEVIIYNQLGQKELVEKPMNNRLDISGLKQGIYTVEVSTKDWKGKGKLIIE